jgi:hypothetical protein
MTGEGPDEDHMIQNAEVKVIARLGGRPFEQTLPKDSCKSPECGGIVTDLSCVSIDA